MFNFDYSYLSLPNKFYSLAKPNLFTKPEIFLLNNQLSKELNISFLEKDLITKLLYDKNNTKSFSQAYAGHQFGIFTKLGDGRAIIIGEHLTQNHKRFDIQLKGSGKTKYSRHGDGKATLRAMLKEYLFSEAIHYLNIPSSRSLAVIKTSEPIYRNTLHDASILARVMKSHIRIGTFEYALHFGSKEDTKAITSYTINRLYPEIKTKMNPSLALLEKVMKKQINLVVNWMRVGFIHGVMNTDNTSLSAETFDYGPCAFINTYKPETTYSSIDHNKRYAFGNQPKIIKWNISRFAESLLPIIHNNKKKSLQLAQSTIDKFDKMWEEKYYSMMLKKIGFDNNDKRLYPLIDELLNHMNRINMDYTNTFWSLSQAQNTKNRLTNDSGFKLWEKKWRHKIKTISNSFEVKRIMKKNNPQVIPRNHLVEETIEKAINGSLSSFQKLLEIISMPYQQKDRIDKFMKPPESKFEEKFQTYCET